MKTKQEIEELAAKEYWNSNTESRSFIKGYTQCQEDLKPLIHDLWQLWLDLAEAGDLQIGIRFNKRFDELEKQINHGKDNT